MPLSGNVPPDSHRDWAFDPHNEFLMHDPGLCFTCVSQMFQLKRYDANVSRNTAHRRNQNH